MQRRFVRLAAFVALVLTVLPTLPALAIDEPDRLWLVGERAFVDGLYPVARRALERFVDRYGTDPRAAQAYLMLGKARLTLGELEPALEAFQRGALANPAPPIAFETRFWEAETLFRLKRYPEARTAYDEVFRNDAGAALAPDALYGFGWTELELKRPESAVAIFRDFLQAWSDHPLAPSATHQMARALLDLKRYAEVVPLLTEFAKKFPGHPGVADAQFLLGSARLSSGDLKNGFADLGAFIDAYPNHPHVAEARRLRRETLAKTGNPRDLQQVYDALMSQSPSTADSLEEAVRIGRRLGRSQEDAAWRKLRADFPTQAVTQKMALEYANAAYKRSQWKETIAYAGALTTSPDDATRAEGWLLTGESELKLKRFPQAAQAFEEVGAIGDSVASGERYRALAGLGLAREELKDYRAALSAYEAATKSPDPVIKQWARDRAAVVKARLNSPSTPAPKTPATKPKGKS
jgi:TolA-binding protein